MPIQFLYKLFYHIILSKWFVPLIYSIEDLLSPFHNKFLKNANDITHLITILLEILYFHIYRILLILHHFPVIQTEVLWPPDFNDPPNPPQKLYNIVNMTIEILYWSIILFCL